MDDAQGLFIIVKVNNLKVTPAEPVRKRLPLKNRNRLREEDTPSSRRILRFTNQGYRHSLVPPGDERKAKCETYDWRHSLEI